jgi:hypothetical protein
VGCPSETLRNRAKARAYEDHQHAKGLYRQGPRGKRRWLPLPTEKLIELDKTRACPDCKALGGTCPACKRVWEKFVTEKLDRVIALEQKRKKT